MKLICIGRNYPKHISELKNEKPPAPVIFLKPDTAILLKKQPFFIPEFSSEVHHEVEVLVKISRVGKYIKSKFAHKYYREVGLGIDFTARDLQKQLKEKGLPWEKSKAFDGSAVIGKWVPKSTYNNLSKLPFSLHKNKEVVQSASTEDMLWGIDEIIAYVSQFFTLKIGDIIFTGTPSGVGVVASNDSLTGYIGEEEFFSVKVK